MFSFTYAFHNKRYVPFLLILKALIILAKDFPEMVKQTNWKQMMILRTKRMMMRKLTTFMD